MSCVPWQHYFHLHWCKSMVYCLWKVIFTHLSICQHSSKKWDWFGTRNAHFLKCSIWPVGIPVWKQKGDFFFIIHTFKHTFNTVQNLGRHILKHLHKEQCDESDQKGPGLSGEIDEVHLCTFSLCSKGQQFHWSHKSWSEAFIPYYTDLLREYRKCVRVEPMAAQSYKVNHWLSSIYNCHALLAHLL